MSALSSHDVGYKHAGWPPTQGELGLAYARQGDDRLLLAHVSQFDPSCDARGRLTFCAEYLLLNPTARILSGGGEMQILKQPRISNSKLAHAPLRRTCGYDRP